MDDINFSPVLPITRGTQFQKGFFPFDAFLSDDPNETQNPISRLKGPWAWSAALGFKAVAADFEFTDDDGYEVVLVTTGATGKTVSWGTTSANAGRLFRIVKVDAGAGAVTLSGVISGVTDPTLTSQYDYMVVFFDGSALYNVGSS